MKATKNIRRFQACVILSIAMSYGLPAVSQGGETCPPNSSGPDICVAFDEGTPQEFFHFTVDYTTHPANPSVTLRTGSLTWNVRSRVGPPPNDTPANMGTISIDPTAVDDFEVSILHGTGPGAINVGGINLDLDPSADGNFSNLSGAKITGTLSGTTWLQRSNGGVGGNVTGALTIDTISGFMIISGDVLAPMTVSTVNSVLGVAILGNLGTSTQSADLDITTLAAGSVFYINGTATNYGDITVGSLGTLLSVGGTVPSGKTVAIQNMATLGKLGLATLAGRLELLSDIPSTCQNSPSCGEGDYVASVDVAVLTGTGVIDLNGHDVAGIMSVKQAHSNSQIIAVGAVSGYIYPGYDSDGFFNGTLSVLSVSETSTLPGHLTGEIGVFTGAALNGTISVSGINAGEIELTGPFTGQIKVGSVADSGFIETSQDALGNIFVSGACAGAIEIGGDLMGTVHIHDALTSTGSVTVAGALKAVAVTPGSGAKILVDGICDGSIAIGEQTDTPTLIHLQGGLDNGSIEINTSRGSTFNADGDIQVGPTKGALTDILFDGCIHIYEGAMGGGSLNGTIIVRGCHATPDDLNICIDGPHNNNVQIVQPHCTNQVDWSCPAPPCP